MINNPFLDFKKEFDFLPAKESLEGFFGAISSAISTVGDTLSGEYFFHVGTIPEIIKKRFLELNGLDLRTDVLATIENNRVGENDSSVLVTDTILAIRSISGYNTANADDVNLRLPLNWITSVELHSNMVYLKLDIPNFKAYELKLNVSSFCDPDIDYHYNKFPLFVNALNKLLFQKQTIDSKNGFGDFIKKCQLSIDGSQLSQAKIDIDEAKENIVGVFMGVFNEHFELLISETEYKKKSDGYFNVYQKYLPLKDFLKKANPLFEILKDGILACESLQSKIDILEGKSYDSIFRLNALKFNDQLEDNKNLNLLFDNHKDFFKKHFLEIPSEKRKVLLYTKSIPRIMPSCMVIVDADLIPNVTFPPSHPQLNKTYVCHPYLRDYYLPTDVYQDFLTDQRIQELFHILRSLGAKKIQYISNSESNQSRSSSTTNSMEVGGGYNGISANQGVSHANSSSSKSSALSSSNYELLYIPDKKPFLPESLVWYYHESEWQRIANDRLNGNLLTFKTFIKKDQFDLVSKDEQTQINSELNALNVGVSYSVKANNCSSTTQENQLSQLIQIEVEFEDVNLLK